MLKRSVYLLAGFVSQGVVMTVWLASRGADWTVSVLALGVDRTIALVSWGVDRTTGLASEARVTLVRIRDAAGVEQAVTAAARLPENAWGAFRAYAGRLGSTARCRARYHRLGRELSLRYRALRRSR
ncbi:MAG: hypothetical protein JW820_18140 [Spirochaetales bacterium]|nr:hypothetical protein [Spirochaetales bacterium]